jgi:hypothetical protein
MSTYATATPEDFEVSGPEVWPNITAYHPVDRYIHRRPELAYLQFMRTIITFRKENGMPEPTFIRYTIQRIDTSEKRKRHERLGVLGHIILSEPKEDVRAFLKNLRRFLQRGMPTIPLPNNTILLRFQDPEILKGPQKTFQEKWL